MKTKQLDIVENYLSNRLLLGDSRVRETHRTDLEIPGVVRDFKQLTIDSLKDKFDKFLKLYAEYVSVFGTDHVGMCCADLFSVWYTLNTVKPDIVIENSIIQGATTWFIRKTLPTVRLFCFDPVPPKFVDLTKDTENQDMTTYFVGENFKDFKDFDLDKHGISSNQLDRTLVFFNTHTNALEMMKQAHKIGIKNVFFSNNYPENCGGHLTLQHIDSVTDNRFSTQQERDQYKEFVTRHALRIVIFPNIVGNRVKTGEGTFAVNCLFKDFNELETKMYHSNPEPELLESFSTQSLRYRWNTYILLK